MACYHPIDAFQCADGQVVFSELRKYDIRRSLALPCGQCIGCRLERSRQWAIRCMHEASLHERNSFVTLSFSDDCLPDKCSLQYVTFQKFMRRVRKHFKGIKIRFFMCGEYSEPQDDREKALFLVKYGNALVGRPHFHVCFFGLDFDDKVYFKKSSSGESLYRSPVLEKLWPFGFSTIGELTFESAAYVARYCVKKINGARAAEHYSYVDSVTGEIGIKVAELCRMSLRNGIGHDWLRLYWKEVIQTGEVVARGHLSAAPRFYLRKMRKLEGYAGIEALRAERHRARVGENSDERLAVREAVAVAGSRSLVRKLS